MTLLADPVQLAVSGAVAAALESENFRLAVALVTFSRVIVFNIFTTFLLPLCSLSFATEALGREREQRNLLWTLTRPLPRWAIYLAKYVALLPWCLALNVGGFYLICRGRRQCRYPRFRHLLASHDPRHLRFCRSFPPHGAIFRRAAVIAILYSFFLETVMGSCPATSSAPASAFTPAA